MTAAGPIHPPEAFNSDPQRKFGHVERLIVWLCQDRSRGTELNIMSRYMTCLIQHIDKGLGVIGREANNPVIHILGREGDLNQGGEFIRDELALEQSSEGWTVAVEKDVLGSNQRSCQMGECGANSYRSRIQRSLKRRENQRIAIEGRVHPNYHLRMSCAC